MKKKIVIVALGAGTLVPALAFAQDTSEMTAYPPSTVSMPPPSDTAVKRESNRIPAPANALEINVGTGYTQGFGMVREGLSVPDVATPGIGFELGAGYRMNPNWGINLSGQYHELTAERSNGARGLTGTLAVQYHARPNRSVDPWVELGTGYRFLWEDPSIGPNVLTHGLQLGRARVGVDFRVDESVAIGPTVGADANLFLFQDAPNLDTNISNPRLNTFIFGGLQGRFDVGGRRVGGGARTVAGR